MPSYKVHRSLWRDYITASVAVGMVLAVITSSVWVGLFTMAGYLVGFWITPDLDQIGIDRTESDWIKSVVLLPLIAWSTLYARIMQVFGGHRSFMSHFPGVSTAIRLAWFLFPVVVLAYFMGWLYLDYTAYIFGLWSGLTVADTVHSTADFQSTLRRKLRRGRSRSLTYERGSKRQRRSY